MIRPRVLLADDHHLLLEAFQKLLEPACEVVGAVSDGRALLEAARKLKPDVIVLDIGMPLLNGLDAGPQIKRMLPKVKLIYLTVSEDPDFVAEAFRMGASGFLLKKCVASELFQAIRDVLSGKPYVTPLATRGMAVTSFLGGKSRRADARLTPRQREVLQLLVEGHTMKKVAEILEITPRTVAYHKYRMMEELKLKSSAELVQLAIKKGIISS